MITLPEVLSGTSVSIATIQPELENVSAQGVLWQADSCRFLLNVPRVAAYLAESGCTVTIDPCTDAPAGSVEHFLGMMPLAALLYQRGLLAFHAAALSDGERAILLCGDSGSGKSTLLALLLQRGWKMLADDLAIVGLDEGGLPTVYPALPGVALWPSSLDRLDIDAGVLPFCDANRRVYFPSGVLDTAPRRLCRVYRLGVHNRDGARLKDLAGCARFQSIGTMLYNSHVADALCDRANYLRCAAAIAQSVPIMELLRPRGVWSVEELAEHISI